LQGNPIILATKSVSIYEIKNTEVLMNIFIRSSRDSYKNGKRPCDGCDTQVENH